MLPRAVISINADTGATVAIVDLRAAPVSAKSCAAQMSPWTIPTPTPMADGRVAFICTGVSGRVAVWGIDARSGAYASSCLDACLDRPSPRPRSLSRNCLRTLPAPRSLALATGAVSPKGAPLSVAPSQQLADSGGFVYVVGTNPKSQAVRSSSARPSLRCFRSLTLTAGHCTFRAAQVVMQRVAVPPSA